MKNVLDKKELTALISLIDEPNEAMFTVIHHKILGYGKEAISALEDVWVNTLDDNNSKRIESLIEEIRQEILITDFNLWASNSKNDIINGLIIITKYLNPDFNEKQYTALFEKLYRDTWLEINDNLTALEKVKVLNHVFFRVYNFIKDVNSTTHSDSYYLNRIFDYKKGSAIVLGILYIAVAQKLNIPIYGVDLPNHFILAYLENIESPNIIKKIDELDVMFYINTSKDGTPFTRSEISFYLEQAKIEKNRKHYLPCTNLLVYRRMLNELIDSLEYENKHSKALALKKLVINQG